MHKNNYELSVLINGKPVREYYHNGKFLIQANENSEYSLKLKNHTHKKIMAVISVDGIDVLKGKSAIEAESGYIVNPYSTLNVTGYRIDDNNVATFKFSDGKTSYATQIEQKFNDQKLEEVKKGELAPAKNNGVIGVRIWEEKEPKFIPAWKQANYNTKKSFYGNNSSSYLGAMGGISISGCSFNTGAFYAISNASGYSPLRSANLSNNITYSCSINNINQFGELGSIDEIPIGDSQCFVSNTMSKGSVKGYIPNFELGTTWGKQQEDKVIKVTFEKADSFIDLEIFYLTREELVKWGVDLEKSKKIFVSGFPSAFSNGEYCQQPNNWNK